MKKLFLTINLIIFSLIVLCSTSLAVESDKAFFQSHNRSLKRATGFFYVESNNGVLNLEKVVRTNKNGNVEKNNNLKDIPWWRWSSFSSAPSSPTIWSGSSPTCSTS